MVDKEQITKPLIAIGKGVLWVVTGIIKLVIKIFATICRWLADELTKPSPAQRRKEQQENSQTIVIVKERCESDQVHKQNSDPFDVVYSSKRMFGRRR